MQGKAQALDRMADLWDLIKQSDGNVPERIRAEYSKLLEDMKKEFLPWIDKLARAGALTISLEKEALTEAREWARDVSPITGKLESIAFETIGAWDNGSIWLIAGQVSMAGGDQAHPTGRN